jgi:hypothetical protein
MSLPQPHRSIIVTAIGKTYRVTLASNQRGRIGRPKPAATRKEAFRIAKE